MIVCEVIMINFDPNDPGTDPYQNVDDARHD
jgi:hypothetical protein